MAYFQFTLKFSLPGQDVVSEAFLERLAEGGCDDALIGFGQAARLALNFDREAESAFLAISSAIEDVKRVIPEARLVEAAPDLVGLTDIADIVACSRQYMRKLMLADGSEFPVAVHEGKTSLWRLTKVLTWLRNQRQYPIDERLIQISETTMHINIAKEVQTLDRPAQKLLASLSL